MPDNPFDRTILNPLEKPLSRDNNRMGSSLDRSLRFLAKAMYSSVAGAPVSGFLQGGFNAVEDGPPAMTVVLKAGLGFQDLPGDVPSDINTIIGLNDLESYKPLPLLDDLEITIPASPANPSSRIDIIEVRADRVASDSQSRDVFDNTLKAFQATPVDKTLGFLLDNTKLGSVTSPTASTDPISLKIGVPGTPGVAPVATSGYIKVAEVFVDGDVVAINNADITDARPRLGADLSIKEIFVPSSLGSASVTFPGPVDDAYHSDGAYHSINPNNFDIDLDLTPFLKVGDRILTLTAYCHDVAVPLDFDMVDATLPGLSGALVTSGTDASDTSGNEQTVPITGISFNGGTNIIESGHGYRVRCQELGVPSNTNRFYGVKVTFDTP